jgi:hypothetical protein
MAIARLGMYSATFPDRFTSLATICSAVHRMWYNHLRYGLLNLQKSDNWTRPI